MKNSIKSAISYFIRKLADYVFRRRSPALILGRCGFAIVMATVVGSGFISAGHEGSSGTWSFSYYTSSTPKLISAITLFIGIFVFISAFIWEFFRDKDEKKMLAKRKTIVIEQRGLVDTKDNSLAEHIRQSRKLTVDSAITDIRERLIDNVVTRPELALEKVLHLKHSLNEKTRSHEVSDIDLVYGGLMPIPFAFLTGYLLDDESKVEVLDWDRDISDWRQLDEDDDKQSFSVEVIEREAATHAVLSVSFSYTTNRDAIATVFPTMSHYHLILNDRNRNNHWSKVKQDRLAGEFFEYCKQLEADGIQHIHLVLASQNSVAFRLGQSYDRRNLPPITVYQYERNQAIKYPWGVLIPQNLGDNPSISEHKNSLVA